MKKTFIFITVLLMASLPLLAERVDPTTARTVAATFLSNNGTKADQLTDLTKEAGFNNLYIFTAEQGFVVMSADDCVTPILGYSLTGPFVAKDMPDNLRDWLQGYDDEIEIAVERHVRASGANQMLWNDLANSKKSAGKAETIVGPLINTLWNQTAPYNEQIPTINNVHPVTGCVATAMAQVMNYWKHPATGTSNHTYTYNSNSYSADFANTTYDWAHMTDTYDANSTDEEKLAVATLMYHCGVSVDMQYGTSESSASTFEVINALKNYFSYVSGMQYKAKDSHTDEEWNTLLKRELDDGRPLQYRGNAPTSNAGHSFVCDGYDSDNNFHFNWGWAGRGNGYYSTANLAPTDLGTGAGMGNYTRNQGAIFGIEPISTLAAPTLQGTLNGTTAVLTWNAVNGATSYDVYKDQVRIATGIDALTYTDNGPLEFGIKHQYHVRARSVANEVVTRSNPSNIVFITSTSRDLRPSSLTASTDDIDVTLIWTGYQQGSTELYYSTDPSGSSYGGGGQYEFYWGQRFPAASLSDFTGMVIDKVSLYVGATGSYTLDLYKENTSDETNQLATITENVSTQGWHEFILNEPVALPTSQGLYVVFYAPTTVKYPAFYSTHPEIVSDAQLWGNSLPFSSYIGDSISWCIKTHITDGTYTYNLYDGTTKVNGDEPISGTTYTVENVTGNTLHTYTVKTNCEGVESEASNQVGVTTGNFELQNLELTDDDLVIVSNGSTCTVSGTLTNNDSTHLVIEHGGQLIHPNAAVKGTLKKTISAYSTTSGTNDGWFTIASPIVHADVDIAATGTYDLYAYDEPTHYWLNQELTANNITYFKEGYGYLYANAMETSLDFAGLLKATDEKIEVPLSYTETLEHLRGFNLLGNPFSRDLVAGDLVIGTNAITTYYIADGGSDLTSFNLYDRPIRPGEGFFVQASGKNQVLTFNPSSKADFDPAYISITTDDGSFTDHAYIQLQHGNTMNKMSLNDHSAKASLRHEGMDYAAITLDEFEEPIPVNFHATRAGSCTITVEAKGMEMEYLHLIDHLTGNDIDLLQTPTYRFETRPDDYTARFQLVFHENDGSTDSSQENENVTVQVIDMLGRVIVSRDATHCVSTLGLPPGVYVIRTINGKDVKTEKIIINK